MPTTVFICIPSSLKRSAIFLEPKHMALIKALKIWGALLPKDKSAMALFKFWSASGVRRPLIQSSAMGILSSMGMASAASDSFLIKLISISSFKFCFCSSERIPEVITKCSTGQESTSLNQANRSPKADCPASRPISPGITDPSTCPQIPLMVL